jgi:hypothetical protein
MSTSLLYHAFGIRGQKEDLCPQSRAEAAVEPEQSVGVVSPGDRSSAMWSVHSAIITL